MNAALVGIILGIAFGLVMAYAIVAVIAKKSCDMGDSEGDFDDFCSEFLMTKKENRVKKDYYDRIQ